ncbi:extracellular solute-binding protein [bacterium]|nr:extracellular solute-binding protein [bacterium]
MKNTRRKFIGTVSSLAIAVSASRVAKAAFDSSLTAYVALDREFSEPVLNDFERESGVRVRSKFDVESTKTIGLTNLIRSEASRPRADIFWNNEIINTIRLKRAGLLASYRPEHAGDFPPEYRDPQGFWFGFAARARVLILDRRAFPNDRKPSSIRDLADPRWRGKCGIAKPFFGTTATHAACLYAQWGSDRADRYFDGLVANQVQVLAGNKPVAEAVAAGHLAFGLTDTDDALVMAAQGHPVDIVYPDTTGEGFGTLFLPNTLAIVKNSPNPQAARRAIDWLYRPDTETRLSEGPSGQIPVSARARKSPKVESPATVKPMKVDFEAAADRFEDTMKRLASRFA